MNGSRVPGAPVEFEGLSSPAVLTRVRVVPLDDVEPASLSAACLRRGWDTRPSESLVERVGVNSETVTFRNASGLYGCDDSPGPSVEHRRWCGSSFGQLDAGDLRDPRLDIGFCSTDDGEPMAFVWVEAQRHARYVAVEQPGFSEVYEVAGGLPVRVATVAGLNPDPLGATFDLSEHDATGRLLRRYRLEALPAG